MTVFTDDFNRPDGGLGNNWTATSGSVIASGRVSLPISGIIKQTTINASGRQEAICTINVAAIGDLNGGPLIKNNPLDSSGYVAVGVGTLAAPTWRIYRLAANGSNTTILSIGGPGMSVGSHTVRLLFNAGILTLWVDGYLIGSVLESTWANQTGAGWVAFTANTALDSYTLLGDEAVSFSVSPSPMGNFGSPIPITFTGVLTSWTPGTPGSPAFTVDHGSLSAQTVDSATTAHATYDPGTFLGTATFTDPSTGATCQVVITSNPTIVPPGGLGDTWSPYKTLVDATGTLFTPDYLLTDRSPVIAASEEVPAALDILSALQQIWLAHFGGWTGVPPGGSGSFGELLALIAGSYTPTVSLYNAQRATSIREELEAVRDALTALRTGAEWNLDDLATVLGGSPIVNHQQLKLAVDAISTGSNQDVLDALAALQGESPPTLAQLGTMLSDLATIAGYDLGSVRGWIDALPSAPSIQPILDKLATIQPSAAITLSTVASSAGTAATAATAADVAVGLLTGGGTLTLATIMEALGVITDLLNALKSGTSGPLWPGLDNVTLGASHALSNGLLVSGPLHGLLFTITGQPEHNQRYLFGTVNSWSRVGAAIFTTDRGDSERSQSFALDTQILVPTTMEAAASATIRLNSGWQGTVRAWSKA